MKCDKCSGESPLGKLQCSSCGSAVSLLAPGEAVPRLPQVKVVELISSSPTGLLWLAEKGNEHQKLLLAEYEPKGGGKALLRDFKSWHDRLKTLPADLLPILSMITIVDERLLLVLEAPGGSSAKKLLEAGRTSLPASEFMLRLLRLTFQFSEHLSGSAHGWIRLETITINSNGTILLGPPAFAPGAAPDSQIDLRECALLSAQWAGIPLRPADTEAEQCKQLRKAEDWALAATIEWVLSCRDRAPQSAGPVIEFLYEAIHVPKGDSEKDLSTASDTLKRLYERSASTIIRREVEKAEERLAGTRKAVQAVAEQTPKAEPQSELNHQLQSQPEVSSASTPAPAPEPLPPQEWHCLKCERVNSQTAKFCSGCGTPRDQKAAEQPVLHVAPQPALNPAPSGRIRRLYLAASILLAMAVASWVFKDVLRTRIEDPSAKSAAPAALPPAKIEQPAALPSAKIEQPATLPPAKIEQPTALQSAEIEQPVTNTEKIAPAEPLRKAGDQKINPKDLMRYVWIPPGRFRMGCSDADSECVQAEKPAHEVTLTRGYWLGESEVTQRAYQRVVGSNPSFFKGEDLPVENVSWKDANGYCGTIGGRLPTEAEWEYAARGGTTGAWYNEAEVVAWHAGNSGKATHPVKQKESNRLGLYDMLGNVWEWTADWYQETYEETAVTDPKGPATGNMKALRGGSWNSVAKNSRASVRSRSVPTLHNFVIGFRCAWEAIEMPITNIEKIQQ